MPVKRTSTRKVSSKRTSSKQVSSKKSTSSKLSQLKSVLMNNKKKAALLAFIALNTGLSFTPTGKRYREEMMKDYINYKQTQVMKNNPGTWVQFLK